MSVEEARAQALHVLKMSRYRGERIFNKLSSQDRNEILDRCNLTSEDINPRYYVNGKRFHEFNDIGRRKIMAHIRRELARYSQFEGLLPSQCWKVDEYLVSNPSLQR